MSDGKPKAVELKGERLIFHGGEIERSKMPRPDMAGGSEHVLVPLKALREFAKSGVNHYQGYSQPCCPVCRYDGLYSPKSEQERKVQHNAGCWLGIALSEPCA